GRGVKLAALRSARVRDPRRTRLEPPRRQGRQEDRGNSTINEFLFFLLGVLGVLAVQITGPDRRSLATRRRAGPPEPLRRRKPPWIRKRRSRSSAMRPATYLVFGDLHGRILPAFRLAQAWAREHGAALDGLLQVGDLGYYPDEGRFDKATRK